MEICWPGRIISGRLTLLQTFLSGRQNPLMYFQPAQNVHVPCLVVWKWSLYVLSGTVRKRSRVFMKGCGSWCSRRNLAGTGRMPWWRLSRSLPFMAKFYNYKSTVKTPRTHSAALWSQIIILILIKNFILLRSETGGQRKKLRVAAWRVSLPPSQPILRHQWNSENTFLDAK